LVIEDDPQSAQLVEDVLTKEGYVVLRASDGPMGLAAAQNQTPDMILMDLQLPGLDGLEVTRRLRADPATRAIPIIALTASVMPGERERTLAAGLDDYLTKPVDIAMLREVVQRWLRRGERGT
jgi:CheY-like chemotaxis protein